MKSKLLSIPLHIFIFSVYPAFALWAHNIGQVGINSTYRAILVSLLIGGLVWIASWLFLHDGLRAGILAMVLLALFFSYGHVYAYVEKAEVFGLLIGRHRFLAVVWLILAGFGVWWVAKQLKSPADVSMGFYFVALFLIVFPLYTFISYGFENWLTVRAQESASQKSPDEEQEINLSPGNSPDIYYIILDGYGRSDVLRDKIGFDNSLFLGRLREKGFYVADCSQSNYGMTALSLASSLNMDYITALGDEFTPDNTDRYTPLWRLIENNTVERLLRGKGYRVVAFETGYDWTEFRNAEYFFSPHQSGLSGFESLLLRNSAALILDDMGVFDSFRLTPEDQKRNLILYVLDEIARVPAIPGPKFVFVHLVIPHQPFVVGPDGEPFVVAQRTLNDDKYYSPKDYLLGYGNQVRFISKQLPDLIAGIIDSSPTPPVIIIQGDHGPAHLEEKSRMAILNAYYLPEGGDGLYQTITPVNSFRMVFNALLDSQLELLPDTSYYSKYSMPYAFETISNDCVLP